MLRNKLFILLAVFVLAGCANRGVGPQGGPKDSIPPMPVKAVPENGAVNFKGRRIEVTFNEYIQLDNIATNLLMSPPQQRPPDVKARGKRLLIQFADSLRDSTTYTLDFGAAVCDFTERNPLHGYSFGFSTGPTIDTLAIEGFVLNAEDLSPMKGILVGIHDDLSDTAFTAHPFLRIARTDSAGHYRISNMHAGTYRLYAVDDVSKDYRLTPGEAHAFLDSLVTVTPPVSAPVPIDTAAADSVRDTIYPASPVPQYNLLLYRPQQKRLYLQRTLRKEQHKIQVLFSSAPDSLPRIHPLQDSLTYHICYTPHADTATIWLLDSASIVQDSLFFEIRYRRTDSLYHLEWTVDTIRAIWREPRLSAKAREAKERQRRNARLSLSTNATRSFEVFDTLRLSSATPLARITIDSMHLYEKIDTLRKEVAFSLAPYDTLPQTIQFIAALAPGSQYELHLDSAALEDVYGVTHVKADYSLKLKTIADYSTLRVRLVPFDPKARIQILNAKGKVLREQPAEENGALFRYLKPDAYFLRMYKDLNGDGQWTTGSWEEHRQPEPVYSYPAKIQTKSNWDFEEEWNYEAR
jgi:hypothetical protein